MIISGELLGNPPQEEANDDPEVVPEAELREVTVSNANHGARLDRALAEAVPELSRSYLQQLIQGGCVQLNNVSILKSSAKVRSGDLLKVELRPTPQSQAFRPEAMALDLVFEDEFLLVLNKPAGLVVHPAPGNWSGTLLNGLLARDLGAAMLPRAGIVHRLDKDTSGLMVVARTRAAMDKLVSMIAARTVSRQYLALAENCWTGASKRCATMPIGRDPRNRLRMAVVDLDRHAGKLAATDFAFLAGTPTHCLVQCSLQTGRTHQIRVHMAAIGHPLVADEPYGGSLAGGLIRQGLHAFRLAFAHPISGRKLEFNSRLPGDMTGAMAKLGLIYSA